MKAARSFLRDGELGFFRTLLVEHCDAPFLQGAREQKLVLAAACADRIAALEALAAGAHRTLDAVEADRFTAHLHLVVLIEARKAWVRQRLAAAIAQLPSMTVEQSLTALGRISRITTRDSRKAMTAAFASDVTIATAERTYHHVHGSLLDVHFAIARALNEIHSSADPGPAARRVDRHRVLDALRRVVTLSSNLNGLDWIEDSVVFGDMQVEELRLESTPRVVLTYCDARRSLIRELAIRRALVVTQFGGGQPSMLRDWLVAQTPRLIEVTMAAIADAVGPCAPGAERLEAIARQAIAATRMVDADDAMLLLAGRGGPGIAGRYLLAMALRVFAVGTAIVSECVPAHQAPRVRNLAMPPELIAALAPDSEHATVLHEAWDEQSTSLPTTSHWDILRRPHIRDAPAGLRPAFPNQLNDWNTLVRQTLVNGGSLASELGRLWEENFAHQLAAGGFKVLGRGIRLKEGGRTATDVDLLLLRGDLLLVVQVKALVGIGLSPHDHWKNRKILENGCRQAALAIRLIKHDRKFIQAVADKHVAEAVRYVEPVVFTNLATFDGWECDGIPILSETSILAITQGARVTYKDSATGQTMHTEVHTRAEDLDTEATIKALRAPIELTIAPESGDVTHLIERNAGIEFHVPTFKLRTGAGDAPEYLATPEP